MDVPSVVVPATETAGGLVLKLLGPTCDYLGEGLKNLVQRRFENVDRILTNATGKAQDRLGEPGEVPPRVLRSVLDEGSYCDNELFIDYFGGVLASSRTPEGRDDRGVTIAKTLEGMSVYQLRAHYLLYSTVRHFFKDSGNTFDLSSRMRMRLFLPAQELARAMELSKSEASMFADLVTHIFSGLSSRGLIGHWTSGDELNLRKTVPDKAMKDRIVGNGVLFETSHIGAELYVWAAGWGNITTQSILDGELKDFLIPGVPAGIFNAVEVPNRTFGQIARKEFE